ncbi:hypothetical protein [Tenacibaculum salmonis]|uniref:hypothetical protein n=1 Tax=Tenacibaculum sp. P3-BQ1 TaxID=3232310 RepID=UPI0034DFF799
MSVFNILCIIVAVLSFLLVLLWGFIIFFIKEKKVHAKNKIKFEKEFLEGIISVYSNVEIKETEKKLKSLKKYLKKDSEYLWRSAAIFVKFNRVVKFSKKKKFQKIFKYLRVNNILAKKMLSKNWYVKAKAIWLSYEFELEKNIKIISRYKDDENTLVRREAQIAIVSFLGWRSLSFFPYITKKISLWQQIRIIEKLAQTKDELDFAYLNKALASENKSVIELIIRIIKNFRLEQYKSYVTEQLFSNNYKLINIAVETLRVLETSVDEIKTIEVEFLNKSNNTSMKVEVY